MAGAPTRAGDAAKIESGNFKLLFEPTEPGRLMQDCARMVDGLARGAGLSLKVDMASGIGNLVIDARVMKQIIPSLLSNAIKFTPAGGSVTLRLAPSEIGGVRIEVADTGIDLPPACVA